MRVSVRVIEHLTGGRETRLAEPENWQSSVATTILYVRRSKRREKRLHNSMLLPVFFLASDYHIDSVVSSLVALLGRYKLECSNRFRQIFYDDNGNDKHNAITFTVSYTLRYTRSAICISFRNETKREVFCEALRATTGFFNRRETISFFAT